MLELLSLYEGELVMTNDEVIQVEALLTYLRDRTNDDKSHNDINWLERLCMNNSQLTSIDLNRLKHIQERTIGYGKEN